MLTSRPEGGVLTSLRRRRADMLFQRYSISLALRSSSSRNFGWAMPISLRVLSRMLLLRSSATPYSVTTRSTMFLNVVTAAPGWSCATMREVASSAVVECRAIKDWPLSEKSAPRAKSGWPPDDDQYWLPSDSEAH